MKRARGFIIMATIATLTFSSVVAFGAETTAVTTTEAAAPAKTYADLSVSDVIFQNDRAENLGVYPKVDGMDDLNTKIDEQVFKAYLDLGTTAQDNFSTNNYVVSYKVENIGRYAKISIDRSYYFGYTNVKDTNSALVYYVDKETNTEMVEADYTAAIAAAAAPAPVVKKTDKAAPVMVKLNEIAEALGLETGFDGKNATLSNGTTTVDVIQGTAAITVDGKEVKLDAAPAMINGSFYIPVTLVELGFTAVADTSKEGFVTVTLGDKKAVVEIVKADALKEAEKEAAEKPAKVVFVPIRTQAVELGYTLASSKVDGVTYVTVSKDDFTAELATGDVNCTVGDKTVKLEAAPELRDGSFYVPASFFKDVLAAGMEAETPKVAEPTMEEAVETPEVATEEVPAVTTDAVDVEVTE